MLNRTVVTRCSGLVIKHLLSRRGGERFKWFLISSVRSLGQPTEVRQQFVDIQFTRDLDVAIALLNVDPAH
jgi:hypothetical protein